MPCMSGTVVITGDTLAGKTRWKPKLYGAYGLVSETDINQTTWFAL